MTGPRSDTFLGWLDPLIWLEGRFDGAVNFALEGRGNGGEGISHSPFSESSCVKKWLSRLPLRRAGG
jgi:hypothetical protein